MRLICPSCDAQYEVSSEAIPEEGRDVQCSACGHAWFQLSAKALARLGRDTDPAGAAGFAPPAALSAPVSAKVAAPATSVGTDEPQAGRSAAREGAADPRNVASRPEAPAGADASAASAEEDDQDADNAELSPPAPRQAPIQRQVDAGVLAVLREEAAREVQARARDSQMLETQGELGLEVPGRRASRPVFAHQGAAGAADAGGGRAESGEISQPGEAAARPARGRELLPDIEEINSTLSPTGEPGLWASDLRAEQLRAQRSFWLGFALMLALAGGGLALYSAAPQIAGQVPGARDWVEDYVTRVDAARLWLHQLLG